MSPRRIPPFLCLASLTASVATLTAQQGSGDISLVEQNVTFDVVFNRASLVYQPASGSDWLRADPAGDPAGVLFKTAWAYRIDNQGQETILNKGGMNSPVFASSGKTGTGSWPDVDGLGLVRADVVYEAHSTGASTGAVTGRLTITNISGNTITLNLFHLADLDLCGTAFNANTTSPGGDGFQVVTGRCLETGEHFASGADRWEVGSYTNVPAGSGNVDLYVQLEDTSITTLRNDTMPFGPYDIRGGFQWQDRVIAPGKSMTFTVGFGHGEHVCAYGEGQFGRGVAGGNGVPQLALGAPARMGGTLQCVIQGGPANFPGGLLLGPVRAALTLGDLEFYVGAPSVVVAVTTDSGGNAIFSAPLPSYPSLCGGLLIGQVIFLNDPSSQSTTTLPITHSPGLALTIGSY